MIVQIDEFNRSRINTVVVVVLTTNIYLSEAPGNVYLKSTQTGLSKDSVANVSQVLTIDKSFLTKKAGKLRKPELQQIESGLRLILGL